MYLLKRSKRIAPEELRLARDSIMRRIRKITYRNSKDKESPIIESPQILNISSDECQSDFSESVYSGDTSSIDSYVFRKKDQILTDDDDFLFTFNIKKEILDSPIIKERYSMIKPEVDEIGIFENSVVVEKGLILSPIAYPKSNENIIKTNTGKTKYKKMTFTPKIDTVNYKKYIIINLIF